MERIFVPPNARVGEAQNSAIIANLQFVLCDKFKSPEQSFVTRCVQFFCEFKFECNPTCGYARKKMLTMKTSLVIKYSN